MDILQMSLSASALIVAVVIIRALTLHKLPKKTFLVLWGVVVCRLLMPFSIPSRFSFYTGIDTAKRIFAEEAAIPSSPVGMMTVRPNMVDMSSAGEPIEAGVSAASISPFEIVWLAGMFVCALFFITAYIKCRREFKTSLPVENAFITLWLREHSLKRPVQIRQSDRIKAPLTYGVFRPVILLPRKIDWTDETKLRYILTHEFTHIRRFDTLTKLVLTAAVCLHWFNPLVWAMYGLANRDIELSCDETVVRTFGETMKSTYALTLIGLEEKKSRLTPLANNFSKYAIEERIHAIMKMKKSSLAGIILALALIVGTVTVFATSAAGAANGEGRLDASAALDQLIGSISYADGELSFQIPENYPNQKDWDIFISGRKEVDGFGMSVHYLTEENESENWEPGKKYTVLLKGSIEYFTDLWLTAFLPDEYGAPSKREIDLLKTISSGTITTGNNLTAEDFNKAKKVDEIVGEPGWWDTRLFILAELPREDITLYGMKEEDGIYRNVAIRSGETVNYYPWSFYVGSHDTVMSYLDYDGDGVKELAVLLYYGNGTAFSVDQLFMLEEVRPGYFEAIQFKRDDYVAQVENIVSYRVNEENKTITLFRDETELQNVDISWLKENEKVKNIHYGDIVRFDLTHGIVMGISPGMQINDRGPLEYTGVSELEATVEYRSDGTFHVTNIR